MGMVKNPEALLYFPHINPSLKKEKYILIIKIILSFETMIIKKKKRSKKIIIKWEKKLLIIKNKKNYFWFLYKINENFKEK